MEKWKRRKLIDFVMKSGRSNLAAMLDGTGIKMALFVLAFLPIGIFAQCIQIEGSAVTHVSCYGANDGGITVWATGGTDRTYRWYKRSPGGNWYSLDCTTRYPRNLTKGEYKLVYESYECDGGTKYFTITEPQPLEVTMNPHIDCSSKDVYDGQVSATAIGGTTPYSYAFIANPNGGSVTFYADANSNTAVDVFPFTYYARVTDANGCVANSTGTATVTMPSVGIALNTLTNVTSCSGVNGTISVAPYGGTGPYQYDWSPGNPIGDGTNSVSGLAAGDYLCTVVDANGVVASKKFVVGTETPLSANASVTNVSCNGAKTGAITINASGGGGTYSYNWTLPAAAANSNITGLGTNSLGNLPAGLYSCVVTGSSGCSKYLSVTVTQPNAIAVTPNITNQSCIEVNNGAISFSWTGGVAPFSLNWTPGNPIGDGTNHITGLSHGTYECTITDANGCVTTNSFTVGINPGITTEAAMINPWCEGWSNGSIAISNTINGSYPYTYDWSPGSPNGEGTSVISGLQPGNYSCLITDANGCTNEVSYEIIQSVPSIIVTPTVTNSAGCPGTLATASVSATGGYANGPYTYSWSPPTGSGSATNTFTTPVSGTYTYTVTDAMGCSKTGTVNITGVFSATVTQTNVSCYGGNNGSASVTVTGGTAPYTYYWNQIASASPTISGLAAGSHYCTIIDATGCSITKMIQISQPSAPLAVDISSQTNVTCYGANNGTATLSSTGGTAPYYYNWSASNLTGQGTASVSGLGAGNNACYITDAAGCTFARIVTITQPAQLVVTANGQTNVACLNGNTGTAKVNVTGGTTPYSYDWTPGTPTGDGTNLITGLTAGTYTCTVTDSKGCSSSQVFNITQPTTALNVTTLSQTNVSCNGMTNGAAIVGVNGAGPFTYNWYPGDPSGDGTPVVSGLSPGNIACAVTDAYGCVFTRIVTITQPAQLVANAATQTSVACYGGNTGAATVNVTGGTAPYTYDWTPGNPTGDGSNSVSGLTAGTYTCSVTDTKGCNAVVSFTITQPAAPLQVTLVSKTNSTSIFSGNGKAKMAVTGGTSPYSYNWTPGNPSGDGTNYVTGLMPNTYTCTVTDAKGCVASKNVTINFGASGLAQNDQANEANQAEQDFQVSGEPATAETAETAEQSENNRPMVYPNPFISTFNVRSAVNASIWVYDQFGKVIAETLAESTETTINMVDYPAGVYYLKVTDNLDVSTFKVVKQ